MNMININYDPYSGVNTANEFNEKSIPKIQINSNGELVLLSLENRKSYVLHITQAIEEASNGTKKIRIGSLYPTLHKLEKKGLVQSRWGDDKPAERAGARRRYYTLTSLGKATVTAGVGTNYAECQAGQAFELVNL